MVALKGLGVVGVVVPVNGVGGSEDTKRLSEGESGTVLRRMKSALGAFFDLYLLPEKPGRGMVGRASVLPFDDGRDVTLDAGECIGESCESKDVVDDDAECENTLFSLLLAFTAFFVLPTGNSVIGRSDASRRYGVVPRTRASLSVDRMRR